jgi:C2H2 type zinc finger protein
MSFDFDAALSDLLAHAFDLRCWCGSHVSGTPCPWKHNAMVYPIDPPAVKPSETWCPRTRDENEGGPDPVLTPSLKPSFPCGLPGCHKSYTTRPGLRWHRSRAHPEIRTGRPRIAGPSYPCPEIACPKSFSTRAGLRYHTKICRG